MKSCRLPGLWLPGLFLLVVLPYVPTLRGGFVYDSIAQVLYSDYIHTPSNRGDVLSLRVVGQDELDRNRPLHLALLMPADAAVWGRKSLGYRGQRTFVAAATKVGGVGARSGLGAEKAGRGSWGNGKWERGVRCWWTEG